MTESVSKIDIAIVGGGIIGLWSTYSILKKYPTLTVVVFEAESYLGEHTTGRNSEVLHSGIYYPKNSLKHFHCLEGNQLWREFIAQKNLDFLACGKIIVARENQVSQMETLFGNGIANEVPGLRYLNSNEITLLKNSIHIDNGFFVPSAGVLNISESLNVLKNEIESMGGIVLTKSKVELISFADENFVLSVGGDLIEASNLVNAGGLFAVSFREKLKLSDYENFYVKGNYLKIKKTLDLDKLIYPIPEANGLGLGVHLTLDTAGGQKFGPDTELVDGIDYSSNESLKDKMYPSIQSIFKNVEKSDLQLAYSGIRPKVKRNAQLVTDFVFQTKVEHKIKGYFEFLGIESPGVTAAPSLAKKLCEAL